MPTENTILRLLRLMLCLLAATGLVFFDDVTQAQQAHRPGVFGGLSVGQTVSVQEKQNYFEIDVISPNPQNVGSHHVVEIGADYLVIEDIVHMTRSWIPVTAIRRINLVNLEPKLQK